MLLLEHGRQVTVLDGDVVRTHLSKGLGFSKEDRDTNIRAHRLRGRRVRAPWRHRHLRGRQPLPRDAQRCAQHGRHRTTSSRVFVDTPLEVCEQRDVKGMYAKARRGEIKDFTGIDDPYEPPLHPEITLDTVDRTPEENARLIMAELARLGFVRSDWAAEHNGHLN